MQLIVPLAGADFIRSNGEVKGLIDLHGEPLLKSILDSRPWKPFLKNIVFILLESTKSKIFADQYLSRWYSGCKFVYLSSMTQGAALSVLSGIGLASNFDEPLIVDLADISYKSNLDIISKFSLFQNCGGIALTFHSSKTCYSYLSLNDQDFFSQAAEKRVISNHASAGTYIYRNTSLYLKSLAYSIENSETQVYNNLHYVCPLFNGIAAQGLDVCLEPVTDILDIKIQDIAKDCGNAGNPVSI